MNAFLTGTLLTPHGIRRLASFFGKKALTKNRGIAMMHRLIPHKKHIKEMSREY